MKENYMTKALVIDRLWESANHGTRREDIEVAYDAGIMAERDLWKASEIAQYLIAAADGSMSKNNSEALATELLEKYFG